MKAIALPRVAGKSLSLLLFSGLLTCYGAVTDLASQATLIVVGSVATRAETPETVSNASCNANCTLFIAARPPKAVHVAVLAANRDFETRFNANHLKASIDGQYAKSTHGDTATISSCACALLACMGASGNLGMYPSGTSEKG
jgi:hypothetical protein